MYEVFVYLSEGKIFSIYNVPIYIVCALLLILTSLRAGRIIEEHISIWWWKSLSVTNSSSMIFSLC